MLSGIGLPESYLFPALCVGVYAWSRFNTPAIWRSTTTKLQYNLALAGYVAAAVALWFVVARLIETNPGAVQLILFGGELGETAAAIERLSAPFAAALFLTVLLPNLPLLQRVDGFIQGCFREIGAIPRKARQLSGMLRRVPYAVPEGAREEVARRLRDQGLDPVMLLDARRGSPAWNWVRIVGLMSKLDEVIEATSAPEHGDEETAGRRIRSTFVRHREAEYERVCAAYRRMAVLAGIVLRDDGGPGGPRADGTLAAAGGGFDAHLEPLRQTFHDECKALLRDLSHLISCGILSSHFSLQRARRHLASWGFGPLGPTVSVIGWNDLAGVMLAVTVYMFVLFWFIRHGDIGRVLLFSCLIGLSMTLAALCAVLPKRVLRGHGDGPGRRLEFGLYILSALLAVLCWFAIHYVRIMLASGQDFREVLAGLGVIYPIALIPAAAAFTIALVTDLDLDDWPVPRWCVRWVEGLVHAAVLAAVAFIAVDWARMLYDALPEVERAARRAPPSAALIVPVQFGLGFIIGALVPHLYRQAARRAAACEDDPQRDDGAWPMLGAAAPAGCDD